MPKKINRKIEGMGSHGTIKGEGGQGTRKMTAKEIKDTQKLIEEIGNHRIDGFIMVLKSKKDSKNGNTEVTGTIVNNDMSNRHIIGTIVKSMSINPLDLIAASL